MSAILKARTLTATVIAVAVLLAGCGGDGGSSERDVEREVAHACDPMKNTGVDYHGPAWSESGRYEVTCSDGSQRIVYP